MGLLDWLTESGLDPADDRLITGALKRYIQSQMLGQAGHSLLDRMSGQHGMDQENERLDIAMKRRALGLQDSADFDESRNSDDTLYAAGMNGVLQKIPEPGFLSPKMGRRGKTLLRTATLVGEEHVVPGIIGRFVRAVR